MLYVSRWVGRGTSVGVVDTDDNVEEVCPLFKVASSVKDLGIDIRGCSFAGKRAVLNPYQPPETKTQLQLKMKILNFVDIEVYSSSISSIRWQPDNIAKPVRIRLSDFGTCCTDYILRGSSVVHRHCVTLVFDDKLSVLPSLSVTAAVHPNLSMHSDVRYDLLDVTNGRLALSVYKSLLAYLGYPNPEFLPSIEETFSPVIDHKARFDRMLELAKSGQL